MPPGPRPLGLIFGISLQQSVSDHVITALNVPAVQLVIFAVLAGVVGVLAAVWPARRAAVWPARRAAVWPARRAAKMDVLRAITSE